MGCSVYERAFTSLRDSQPDAKEEAVMLLEAWRSAEAQAESGSAEDRSAAVQAVEKRMPKRIKRKVLCYCLSISQSLHSAKAMPIQPEGLHSPEQPKRGSVTSDFNWSYWHCQHSVIAIS